MFRKSATAAVPAGDTGVDDNPKDTKHTRRRRFSWTFQFRKRSVKKTSIHIETDHHGFIRRASVSTTHQHRRSFSYEPQGPQTLHSSGKVSLSSSRRPLSTSLKLTRSIETIAISVSSSITGPSNNGPKLRRTKELSFCSSNKTPAPTLRGKRNQPLFHVPEIPTAESTVISNVKRKPMHVKEQVSLKKVVQEHAEEGDEPLNDTKEQVLLSASQLSMKRRPPSIMTHDLNEVPESFVPLVPLVKPSASQEQLSKKASDATSLKSLASNIFNRSRENIKASAVMAEETEQEMTLQEKSPSSASLQTEPDTWHRQHHPVPVPIIPTSSPYHVLLRPGPPNRQQKLKALLRLHRNALSSTDIQTSSSLVTKSLPTLTTTTSAPAPQAKPAASLSLNLNPLRATRRSNSFSAVPLQQLTGKSGLVKETTSIVPSSLDECSEILQQLRETLNVESIEGMVNQYIILKEIGNGSFGKCQLVYDKDQGKYFASKVISKKRLRNKSLWRRSPPKKEGDPSTVDLRHFDYMDLVRREIAILKKLSCHPHIATLVEVLDDVKSDSLYMIFELCEYGPIMRLKASGAVSPFTEDLARRYFRDVVLGLEYLHHLNIVHRDLKPENIYLNAENHAVIGDFSISYCSGQSSQIFSHVLVDNGNAILTPKFTPPEMLTDIRNAVNQPQYVTDLLHAEYRFSTDIWCLGVTLFSFTHGFAPFISDDIQTLYRQISEEPIANLLNPALSGPLQNLLLRLLERDPSKRITIPDIRKHAWVTSEGKDPMISTEANLRIRPFSPISVEDLENALQPVTKTFWNRLRAKIGGKYPLPKSK